MRLLAEGDTAYAGGLLVLPAALAKGLEFDCVIVAECNAEVFRMIPSCAGCFMYC